ncbi:MAG: flagellar biosynthesis protein FlhF [Chitinivibrionales bacterium]|nr:flagellar biosynthesis protein FlhF [Chitinivibrionales bacterium]
MRIKKFSARSMSEALAMIKQELGNDAVILKTRKIPKKLFALGNQDEIEVTAAIDEAGAPTVQMQAISVKEPRLYQRPRPQKPPAEVAQYQSASPREFLGQMSHVAAPEKHGENTDKTAAMYQELKGDILSLKEMVATLFKTKAGQQSRDAAPSLSQTDDTPTGGWAKLIGRLVAAEVREPLAREIVAAIRARYNQDGGRIDQIVIEEFARRLPTAEPIEKSRNGPCIAALVGPTGSGKTTTLAKIAAQLSLTEQKNITLITADTYRIAAIEQIRTFADIVGIELHVVFAPDEIEGILNACGHSDVILVDTAGRSQRNVEHMQHLHSFIDALKPDEIHLTLSATTKDSDLANVVETYKSVGINRLLFTKLDETVQVGNMVNITNACSIPVSYFTAGQSVPDDIEPARVAAFVKRLLKGTSR